MSTKRLERVSNGGRLKFVSLLAALVALSGCSVSQSVQTVDRLERVGDEARIVLMPPDIRYYLLTAGGLPEPNKEWTEAAQANFASALTAYAAEIGANITMIDKDNLSDEEYAYETLHSAVGNTLLTHHFGYTPLPSKAGVFDWSLGPGISQIGENHDADYGLFVFYRDYQASGGRMAFSILAMAAGAYVPAGMEIGFASLVDLNTGEIVWFNVVQAGQGEMRDVDGARTAVNYLFKDLPAANTPAE